MCMTVAVHFGTDFYLLLIIRLYRPIPEVDTPILVSMVGSTSGAWFM